MNKWLKKSKLFLFPLLFAGIAPTTTADDTDIYVDIADLPAEEVRPNLLFILDSSGSMNLPIDPDNGTYYSQEGNNYDPSIEYEGYVNNSGGEGDDDYLYLYRRYFSYTYYNKLHKDQIDTTSSSSCPDIVTDLSNNAPYLQRRVRFQNIDSSVEYMCQEGETCNYITDATGSAGNNGDLVSCNSSNGTRLYFVSSNYHNYLQSYYRYTVLQRVMRDLIDEDYDVNMSLMRFNNGNGGYLIKESVLANDDTGVNQSELKEAVDNIDFNDYTPLTETLWEAYRYLAGLTDNYGGYTNADTPDAAYSSGSTYNSPIDYECQKSHILLLTDGTPSTDTGNDGSIESSAYTGSNCSGNCLDEFAGWIQTNGDNNRDHSSITGIQEIAVNTIGFGSGADPVLLNNTANNGGGIYRAAEDADELLSAFKEIISGAIDEKDTFVAPAVAVNAYNGLQHRNELYFALFQPGNSPRWNGNIKKYILSNGEIVDANNNLAIDASTGYFSNSTLSLWSTSTNWPTDNSDENEVDGSNIEYGGFAYELTNPSSRNIFTYTGTEPTIPSKFVDRVAFSEPLPDTITSITSVTTDLLGLGASDAVTEAEATNVVRWARGGDSSNTESNYFLADFIHNQPSVVTYRTVDADNDIFDDTIFAGSNMGYFHAIDADNGSEVFTLIPKELLSNLTTYYQDTGGFRDKIYGLDAPMAIWRKDSNNNGSIVTTSGGIDTPETGDHLYIYQGMRRGGRTLYAFDVSRRDTPKLMWQITGGITTGFDDLGQTWSVPQKAKVRWNCTNTDDPSTCTTRHVLFFGGGHDTANDEETLINPITNSDGVIGNSIYMIDAYTGELLWSAGSGSNYDLNLNAMDSSITANLTVADIDGQGFADFLFAVDLYGSLWRIDLNGFPTNTNDFADGGIIAELGGTGSHLRRFYNAPDVAFIASRGTASYLTISVGSGFRAKPRNEDIQDRLYVIYDANPFEAPSSYQYVDNSGTPGTIGTSDLNAVSNLLTGFTLAADTNGWYYSLDSTEGEKILSRTVTFNNQILFTSFLPNSSNSCEGSTGVGKRYLVDILDGRSTLIDDNDNVIAFEDLEHGGIPPEPTIIFSPREVCVTGCEDGETPVTQTETELVACVGTECEAGDLDLSLHKSYWREN